MKKLLLLTALLMMSSVSFAGINTQENRSNKVAKSPIPAYKTSLNGHDCPASVKYGLNSKTSAGEQLASTQGKTGKESGFN